MLALEQIPERASKILSEKLNNSVTVERLEVLTPENRKNRIIRIFLHNLNGDLPNTLIIKQAASRDFNPQDFYAQTTVKHFNDWAGIQFLSDLSKTEDILFAPKFYGGHNDLGYIMEDLGNHKNTILLKDKNSEVDASLVGPLLKNCPQEAEKALTLWIECLGRMHAVTIGKEKIYDDIRNQLGSRKEKSREFLANWFRKHIETIKTVCKQIGFVPETQFYNELFTLADTIENPGPFLSYTHGDPCPDNCSIFDGKLRLIDFEMGSFRHALFDAVYAQIAFPTCWCSNALPTSILNKLESAYRMQLIRGCPEAADDETYQRGVIDASAYWTMLLFQQLIENIEHDNNWGIASKRQRILTRLEKMSALDGAYNHLPAITETSTKLVSKLRQLWPNTEGLPFYPAFT